MAKYPVRVFGEARRWVSSVGSHPGGTRCGWADRIATDSGSSGSLAQCITRVMSAPNPIAAASR